MIPPKNLNHWQTQITKILQDNLNTKDFKHKTLDQLVEEISTYYQELEYQNEELIRTQEDLNETREHYVELFEEAPIAYIVIDENHQIVAANREFCHMTGATPELTKSTHFEQWVAPESQDALYLHLLQLKNASTVDPVEVFIKSPSEKRFVTLQSNLFDVKGKNQIRISLVDITDRKRIEHALEESKDQLLWFFSQSLYGFFFMMLDEPIQWDESTNKAETLDYVLHHGHITRINSAMLHQYRAKEEEFLHLTPYDLFLHDLDYGRQILRGLFDKGRWHVETDERRFDGTNMWVEGDYICLYDEQGRITGHFGVQADITERKQAEENLKFQLKFEKMVSEISSHFISLPAQQIDDGINHVLQTVGTFFNVDRTYIFQFSDDGIFMSNTHEWCANGIASQMSKAQNDRIDALPWWDQMIRTNEYVHIPDVNELPSEAKAEKAIFQSHSIQSLLCVPLVVNRSIAGFFGLDTVKNRIVFTPDQVLLLNIVAEIMSNALARRKDFHTIYHLSFYDQLTGLYSRRFYDEELQRLDVPRNLPLTIAILDVNGLKLTNDAFGHHAGDQLLQKVASVLRRECRTDDIIARIGGDEFIIILPKTDSSQAHALTARICTAVSSETIEALPLSVSCGLATKLDKHKKVSDVFKEAEDKMYRTKISERSSYRHAVIELIMSTLYIKIPQEQEHSHRVSELCRRIGRALGLSQVEVNELTTAGVLHDIGKIVVSNDLLNKPGALSTLEWRELKRHPEVGYSILSSVTDYAPLAEYVFAHHERWDGTGYPKKLKGEAISLPARIIALADTYDAMTSDRSYRKALSHATALEEIKVCAGSQFDPTLTEIFLHMMQE